MNLTNKRRASRDLPLFVVDPFTLYTPLLASWVLRDPMHSIIRDRLGYVVEMLRPLLDYGEALSGLVALMTLDGPRPQLLRKDDWKDVLPEKILKLLDLPAKTIQIRDANIIRSAVEGLKMDGPPKLVAFYEKMRSAAQYMFCNAPVQVM